MKHVMQFLKYLAAIVVFLLGFFLFVSLSLDALEWESTGSCEGCTILPKIDDRFQSDY